MMLQEKAAEREERRDREQREWQTTESQANRDERTFNKWTRVVELVLITATVIAATIAIWVALSGERQINVTIEPSTPQMSDEEREPVP